MIATLAVETGIPVQFLEATDDRMLDTMLRVIAERRG